MSSDSTDYLRQLDWNAIAIYRKDHQLCIGLTASIEAYGNTPLLGRLKWARKHDIDFFYSFRAPEYCYTREDYKYFFKEGYKILNIEFSANPLLYYPFEVAHRDLPFVFLGSSNLDKQERYREWFGPVFSENSGFINGPGWRGMNSSIPMNLNRFIYARARVGLNLHLEEQINWANEINERTYTLAAVGIPQLIDNPKLLLSRFSEGAMFKASSPKDYLELFNYILETPDEAQRRASIALEEVYAKYTSFHRMENFIKQINEINLNHK